MHELRAIREALKVRQIRIKSTIGTISVNDPLALGKLLKRSRVLAKELDSLQVSVDRGPCKCNATLGVATLKRRLTVARMIFADQRRDCRRALKSPPQRLLRERARERGRLLYSAADIRTLVNVACYRFPDPCVMKVESALEARRPVDEYETSSSSFAGADRS